MSPPPSDGDPFAASHCDEPEMCRLVGLAKEGDQAAFERLWVLWHESLWRILAYLVANEEDARSLTQDTFVKAWMNLHQLRDPVAFPGWLRRIARNEASSFLKTRQKHQEVPLEEDGRSSYQEQYTVQSPEEIVEVRMVLQQALSKVRPHFREALYLWAREGLSKSEIAQAMSISEESVYSYVSCGRKQLRQAYQDILAEKGNHLEEGGASQ